MTVLAGILHDSFNDENGKEVAYTETVIGKLEEDVFKCVGLEDFDTFDLEKEEFFKKVTDIKTVF